MATITEFSGRLRAIDGIADYVLLHNDGRLLTSSSPFEESFLATLSFLGRSAAALRNKAGLSHLNYLELGRRSGQNLLLFPFHDYLLGITRAPEAPSQAVAGQIGALLHNLNSGG